MAYESGESTTASRGRLKERAKSGEAVAMVKAIIEAGPKAECVYWPFATNNMGYGHVRIGGRNHLVHRLVCEAAHGRPPSDRHMAAHRCGNGKHGCCNSACLYWATAKQNQGDRLLHGTDGNGPKNPMARLSTEQVLSIRMNPNGLTGRELAAQFGVSPQQVSRIRLGLRRAVA